MVELSIPSLRSLRLGPTTYVSLNLNYFAVKMHELFAPKFGIMLKMIIFIFVMYLAVATYLP